jgi:hypothetical protein
VEKDKTIPFQVLDLYAPSLHGARCRKSGKKRLAIEQLRVEALRQFGRKR